MSTNKIKKAISDEIERIIGKCGNDLDVTEVLTLPLLRMIPLAAVEGWEEHSYPSGKEFVRLACFNLNDEALKSMLKELKAIDNDIIAKIKEEEEDCKEIRNKRRIERDKLEAENALHVSKANHNVDKALELWSGLLSGRLARFRSEFAAILPNTSDEIIEFKLCSNIDICRRVLKVSDEVHQTLNDIYSLLTSSRAKLVKTNESLFVDVVDCGLYWNILAKEDITLPANVITVIELGISLASSTPLNLFHMLGTSDTDNFSVELISRRGKGSLLIHSYSFTDIKIEKGTLIAEVRGL